jgi:pimeloyl-ACP methyl ester carboxylesterase
MPLFRILGLIGIVLFPLLLSSCAGRSVESRLITGTEIANAAGFESKVFQTQTFRIAGFQKVRSSNGNIVVYIEGDGFAWVDRYTISENPTPINPVALKLATLDLSQHVVHLARPCQYVDTVKERSCDKRAWTSHRFSKGVIDSYSDILDEISSSNGSVTFHLVGFSGGGAVAALLASQRSDVASLRTIAGNLDHVRLNKTRKVSQLTGSLDPMKGSLNLRSIPQIHYSGTNDKTVPSWVARSFAAAVGNGSCVQVINVRNVDHMDGWENIWRSAYKTLPTCVLK